MVEVFEVASDGLQSDCDQVDDVNSAYASPRESVTTNRHSPDHPTSNEAEDLVATSIESSDSEPLSSSSTPEEIEEAVPSPTLAPCPSYLVLQTLAVELQKIVMYTSPNEILLQVGSQQVYAFVVSHTCKMRIFAFLGEFRF